MANFLEQQYINRLAAAQGQTPANVSQVRPDSLAGILQQRGLVGGLQAAGQGFNENIAQPAAAIAGPALNSILFGQGAQQQPEATGVEAGSAFATNPFADFASQMQGTAGGPTSALMQQGLNMLQQGPTPVPQLGPIQLPSAEQLQAQQQPLDLSSALGTFAQAAPKAPSEDRLEATRQGAVREGLAQGFFQTQGQSLADQILGAGIGAFMGQAVGEEKAQQMLADFNDKETAYLAAKAELDLQVTAETTAHANETAAAANRTLLDMARVQYEAQARQFQITAQMRQQDIATVKTGAALVQAMSSINADQQKLLPQAAQDHKKLIGIAQVSQGNLRPLMSAAGIMLHNRQGVRTLLGDEAYGDLLDAATQEALRAGAEDEQRAEIISSYIGNAIADLTTGPNGAEWSEQLFFLLGYGKK